MRSAALFRCTAGSLTQSMLRILLLVGGGANLRKQLVGGLVVDRYPHQDVGRKHIFSVERSVPIIGSCDHGAVEIQAAVQALGAVEGDEIGHDVASGTRADRTRSDAGVASDLEGSRQQ